jgi:hypothetical protein
MADGSIHYKVNINNVTMDCKDLPENIENAAYAHATRYLVTEEGKSAVGKFRWSHELKSWVVWGR